MLGGMRHVGGADSMSAAQKLPSPGKALTWSLAWTLVPIVAGTVMWNIRDPHVHSSHDDHEGFNPSLPLVLIASGVIIGPSAGYIYGDCAGRGHTGIAIRGILTAATIVTVKAVADSYESTGFMDFSGLEETITAGAVGCGIIVIDAIYDLARVQHNVQAQNNRKQATRIGLVPGFSPSSGTPTLSLQVKF